MAKPDDVDRPALAPIDTAYTTTRTVPALRRDRVPTTTPASVGSRPRTVGPNLSRPGLAEYLIVARRRP